MFIWGRMELLNAYNDRRLFSKSETFVVLIFRWNDFTVFKEEEEEWELVQYLKDIEERLFGFNATELGRLAY